MDLHPGEDHFLLHAEMHDASKGNSVMEKKNFLLCKKTRNHRVGKEKRKERWKGVEWLKADLGFSETQMKMELGREDFHFHF